MYRLALFLLVGFLATSASGIIDLFVPEQCSLSEPASAGPDGACPPTCARCHCTGAFDVTVHVDVADTPLASLDWLTPATAVPQSIPLDILHVPKPALG